MDVGLDRRGVCQERADLPLPKMTGFSRKGKTSAPESEVGSENNIFGFLEFQFP
jgi:hypothetical protein